MNNDTIVTTFASKKKSGWSMEPDTGVKIYHKPTGKEFSCEIYKSTHRNKAHCVECLEQFLVAGVSMKNRYDVDVSYHTGKLNQIIRDMDNYTPDELARSLLRLANAADGEVFQEKEFTKPVKVKPLVWSRSMGVPCLCVAVTEFGLIRIEQHLLKHGHCFNVCSDIECNSYAHKSEESAKQAAQEHYEKLVLGSIDL